MGFRSPESVPTIYLQFVHLPWRYVSSNCWLFKLLLIAPFFHAFKSSQSLCLARWGGSPPHFTDGEAGSASWPESQSKNKSQPGWRGPGDRTGVEGLLGGCPTHRGGLEGLLFQFSAKGSPWGLGEKWRGKRGTHLSGEVEAGLEGRPLPRPASPPPTP